MKEWVRTELNFHDNIGHHKNQSTALRRSRKLQKKNSYFSNMLEVNKGQTKMYSDKIV